MFTYVSNVTVRVAAMLVAGTSAVVREAATDVEDVVVITCRDEDAPLVASAFRRAGRWLDRSSPPRPARGGTRRGVSREPIVGTVLPVLASSRETPFDAAFTPEMEALVRRSQRR